MTTEAIQLDVFRDGSRLLVVPGALSDIGFQDLDQLIVVGAEGLAGALETGERSARAITALPRDKRFGTGTPTWKQAGYESEQQFVKGTALVSIVRDDELTELFFMVAARNLRGGDIDDGPEALGRGTPLTVVAEHVLAMFAKHDR